MPPVVAATIVPLVPLNGAIVELNGTKKGEFSCVTRPKAVNTEGFPALSSSRGTKADTNQHGSTLIQSKHLHLRHLSLHLDPTYARVDRIVNWIQVGVRIFVGI